MTKMMMIPAGLCFLLSGWGTARAEVAISASLVITPPIPVPTFVPPAPLLTPPVAPVAHYAAPRPVAASPVVTGGQWVYTSQYGWIYMPYGDQYAYSHAASSYAYVYYPAFGWRWLAAPWIIGSGPYPHFGAHGPFAYGWYRGLSHAGHPWGEYYAHLHGRPYVAPRAAVRDRPVHVGGAPTVGAPARPPLAPARPNLAPRAVTPSRPAVVAQHGVGSVARGPAVARANVGVGRAPRRR
jgi:hypothetical protein